MAGLNFENTADNSNFSQKVRTADDGVERATSELNQLFSNVKSQFTGNTKDLQVLYDSLLKQMFKNQQAEIDLLADGAEKRRMQLELDYKKEYAEIKKLEAEWKASSGGSLIKEQNNVLIQRKTNAEKKYSKGMEKALKKDDYDLLKASTKFLEILEKVGTQTTASLKKVRDALKDALNDSEIDLKPEEREKVQKAFDSLDLKIAERNPFSGLIDAFKDYFKAREAIKNIKENQPNENKENPESSNFSNSNIKKDPSSGMTLAEAEQKEQQSIQKIGESVNGIGAYGSAVTTGVGQIVGVLSDFGAEVPEVVSGTLAGVSQVTDSLAGISLTNPVSIIKGAFGALAGLGKMAAAWFKAGDAKHDENIKKMQKEIDGLSDSYADLEREAGKLYSTDKAEALETMNENLEEQSRLIEQQMQEEQDKKNTDKAKMKEYQDRLDENKKKIEENKEAAIEAICGTGITEAINEFAQAYADAWINGTSMAEGSAKVVKNLIRNSIVGLLEKELNSGVRNLMTKIAEFMADGVLEPWEEAELQRMKEELDQQAEEYLSGAGSILNDSFEQEASKGGFNTMSQETADELNGRFTALQISGEEVKNQMVQAVIHLTNMASVSSQNGETLNLILEQHAKSNDYLDEISACTKKILASFGKKIDVLNYKLQTI